VLAAFQVGHDHSSIYSCALCHTLPSAPITCQICSDTVVALCAGLWPAAVFTADVLTILLSPTAAIYRSTSSRAAALLKRLGQKVPDYYCLTRINCTLHRHFLHGLLLFTFGDSLFFFFFFPFILFFFVPLLIFLLNVSLLLSSVVSYDYDGKITCTYKSFPLLLSVGWGR
jgi:hypothetical protein